MAATETVSDHTKRSAWQASFWMPSNPDVQYVLFCGAGIVNGNTYGPPGSGASRAILAGGQYAGTTTGFQQVYIDTNGNPQCVPVASTSVSFPAGSLALCFLILDSGGRIQSLSDQRTSYLGSAPNLGSGMTESIAAPTLRAGFVANYYVPRTSALTPQIPQDLSLPAPGFFLGSGAVVISSNTISTPTKYYSTATNAAGDGWGSLAINSLNQLYVDPGSGQVTVRQIPASGSGTFIANCLPICEVTTDSVGLIRSLVDFRLSYI